MTLPRPYYDHGGICIFNADCRDILPALVAERGKFDLLLTDPPYGIDYENPGAWRSGGGGEKIANDDVPFDPAPLLSVARQCVLFGADAYADKLPASYGWFVWDKRCGAPRQKQGDAELAWCNAIGSTRVLRHSWNGGGTFLRENGSPHGWHPTQKPVALMRECLSFFPDARTVLDPYMGSGPVARACKDAGLRYVGIEIVEKYCEIAVKRLAQECLFA